MGKRVEFGAEVEAYARQVVRNKVPACRLVKAACQRHLDDLKRDDIYFDGVTAAACFKFLSFLRQFEGEHAGKPLLLHQSQKFILGSMVGWKRKSDGLRRFRVAYVELPRKNGKSTLAGGAALWFLMADQEGGAQVYSVATKEDQARIVWRAAKEMSTRSQSVKSHLTYRTKNIIHRDSASTFRPLGSDSDTQDGLNPHFAIFDELHAWKNKGLWTVIEEGMGARSQPLIMVITTAGNNVHGVCYEQRSHVERILTQKSYDDDTYFGFCAGIDKEDLERNRWTKPKAWAKANPLLGVSKKVRFMEDKAKLATKLPSEKNAFHQFHLNVWIRAANRWLDVAAWEKLARPAWEPKSFDGRRATLGVDLAAHKDLTCVAWIFHPTDDDETPFVWPRFFMPADTLQARCVQDKVPFDEREQKGWITACPGSTMNYDFLIADIHAQQELFDVESLGIDPWNSAGVGPKLLEEGIDVVNVRQGFATMNRPCKELECMIAEKRVAHDGNPVMSWCVDNVVTVTDSAGNLKPDKAKSNDVKGAATKRIDGVTALLTGLAVQLEDDGASAVNGLSFLDSEK